MEQAIVPTTVARSEAIIDIPHVLICKPWDNGAGIRYTWARKTNLHLEWQ